MQMDRLFLGIDGGQSSTTALLGDSEGRVIGAGRGGPANHAGAAEGRERLISAVTSCLSDACRQAGISLSEVRFASACMGFSGGPDDKREILAELLPADTLTVTNDAVIALSGATGGEPGIITIGGTGSIAFGRNAIGRTARAGGWGYIYGDEGGAFDIVKRAVRAALRHEEGWGPPTFLKDRLMAETGTASANAMMHKLYTAEYPKPRVARLAPLVDATAKEGDTVAQEILHAAAQDLAFYTSAVRRRLFTPHESVKIAYIGGVFRSQTLLYRFAEILTLDDRNEIIAPVYIPAAGALLEAYKAIGLPASLSDVPEGVK